MQDPYEDGPEEQGEQDEECGGDVSDHRREDVPSGARPVLQNDEDAEEVENHGAQGEELPHEVERVPREPLVLLGLQVLEVPRHVREEPHQEGGEKDDREDREDPFHEDSDDVPRRLQREELHGAPSKAGLYKVKRMKTCT